MDGKLTLIYNKLIYDTRRMREQFYKDNTETRWSNGRFEVG